MFHRAIAVVLLSFGSFFTFRRFCRHILLTMRCTQQQRQENVRSKWTEMICQHANYFNYVDYYSTHIQIFDACLHRTTRKMFIKSFLFSFLLVFSLCAHHLVLCVENSTKKSSIKWTEWLTSVRDFWKRNQNQKWMMANINQVLLAIRLHLLKSKLP